MGCNFCVPSIRLNLVFEIIHHYWLQQSGEAGETKNFPTVNLVNLPSQTTRKVLRACQKVHSANTVRYFTSSHNLVTRYRQKSI